MFLKKILILVAIGLVCTNGRVLKKKIRRIATPSCGCPVSLEPTYGCFGTCNCKNIFLDEVSCGCQYMETYGVLNPELPNCGRIPAIKMPIANCDPGMPVGSYDAVLPAINLPGLCEVLPQVMPCVSELPCSCQAPLAYQFVETCGCRMQSPIIELPSPIIKTPTDSCIQAPKCLPQVKQLPYCGCQSMPCGCQNMPCAVNMPCNNCQNLPCSCQNIVCSCQNMPCGCQSRPCGCQNSPCGCQNVSYSCQNCKRQNAYAPQLPLELPCACKACQSLPLEIPVYGCGCQSLPPPVIGCGGKYLRQVTIQPPFL